MKKTAFIIMLMLFCSWQIMHAQKAITGKVTDARDGTAVPGVSVMVKGTTLGTITNLDGEFTINGENGQTLVFKFVGYATQEIIIGDAQSYQIALATSEEELEEVVVTALGIKREKKALGYSMQEVKGENISENQDPNVANFLTGKVAGLQVRQASTGPSGSSRIVIRGNNSIAGSNQPLIVVDGIPINSGTGGTDDYWGNRNVDRGSGLADISPDDIETISVLKGPAAAALYGSMAGNGVIMITTKTGKTKKGLGISFNTNTTFETPMETPEFQNEYGQGVNGVFNVESGGSWGAKMTGQSVNALMGTKNYSPEGNDLYKDFLQTGITSSNSIELTTGTENTSLRVGLSRIDNRGVVPNSTFKKTSFDIRGTGKWNKLSTDVKINYIRQLTENRIKLASDPDNIFLNYLIMPRSVAMSDYQKYEQYNYAFEEFGSPASYIENYGGMSRSPYWSAYRNTNKDNKDRLIGFFALQYDFTKWLNLKVRHGLDYGNTLFQDQLATGTPYWLTQGFTGDYRVISEIFRIQNTDFLLTAQGKVLDKLSGVITLGGNLMNYKATYQLAQAQGLFIPDLYTIPNGVNRETDYVYSEKEIRSFYGAISLSYDSWAYLDITGRNDISSTLPSSDRSYFYPSVGASIILSQLLNNNGILTGPLSFAKVRASWAKVGNDTKPYSLEDYMNIKVVDGILTANPSNTKNNPNLKPESIQSLEFGLDIRFLKNRLGFDFTYYKKNSFDQIFPISVPPATGYQFEIINAGNIENKGIEIALNGIPFQNQDFNWDITVNFSKNQNKVIELNETTQTYVLSDPSVNFLKVVAEVGGSYGDILGYTYQRNENGQVLVDDNGIPLRSNDMSKIGNYQPNWMMGVYNNFKIYGISLGFLVDMRIGGDIYMGSIRSGATSGTLAMTLEGRDGNFVVPNSVVESTGSQNSIEISAQDYWNGISSITETWMYDATNICLRELSFGYTLPSSFSQKLKLSSVKLSLVGRNLFMIYSKTKGFNPEGTYSTGNAQGIEYGTMPHLRSFGFNLNLSF